MIIHFLILFITLFCLFLLILTDNDILDQSLKLFSTIAMLAEYEGDEDRSDPLTSQAHDEEGTANTTVTEPKLNGKSNDAELVEESLDNTNDRRNTDNDYRDVCIFSFPK